MVQSAAERHATKEEVFEAFERAHAENKNFYIIKIDYALLVIRYYSFSDEVRGQRAEDVYQIVAEKILTGERKWYREKIPDFSHFFSLAIKSYIRNEAKKKERVKEVDIFDAEGNEINELELHAGKIENEPENFYKNAEELAAALLKALEDDPFAYFVFEERFMKKSTNKTAAQNLGLRIEEVEAAYKRIMRRAKRLKLQLLSGQSTQQPGEPGILNK